MENDTVFDFSPEVVNILYTFSDLLWDVHTTHEVFFNQFKNTFLDYIQEFDNRYLWTVLSTK